MPRALRASTGGATATRAAAIVTEKIGRGGGTGTDGKKVRTFTRGEKERVFFFDEVFFLGTTLRSAGEGTGVGAGITMFSSGVGGGKEISRGLVGERSADPDG